MIIYATTEGFPDMISNTGIRFPHALYKAPVKEVY